MCQVEAEGVHPVRDHAMSPIEYLTDIINSPLVDDRRRDRAALALALVSFFHKRKGAQTAPTDAKAGDWGDDLRPSGGPVH